MRTAVSHESSSIRCASRRKRAYIKAAQAANLYFRKEPYTPSRPLINLSDENYAYPLSRLLHRLTAGVICGGGITAAHEIYR